MAQTSKDGEQRFKGHPTPLTVDQINADRLFDIAAKYWAPKTAGQHAGFDAQLISYIYSHEILRSRFTSRRMSMLELSQYLDLYLWPNYVGEEQQRSHIHVLSIVALVNEKFRQRADAWRSVRGNPKEFPVLFLTVLHLVMSYFDDEHSPISSMEMTQLLQFLTNCFISLEEDVVRECVQKLFGLPIWACLSAHRRQLELKTRPKLAKIWAKLEKSEGKKSQQERETFRFYTHYMFNLTEKMIHMLEHLTPTVAAADDNGTERTDETPMFEANGDVQEAKNAAANVRALEKFFDLVLECISSLNTRRFFVFLLDEYHFTMRCRMAPFLSNHDESSKVLSQLLQQIDIYMQFELSLTGADLPRKEIVLEHYRKVEALQKAAFKLYPDTLRALVLAPVKDVVGDDNGVTLRKFLKPLTYEQLKHLATFTGVVPTSMFPAEGTLMDGKNVSSPASWIDNQDTLIGVLINYYTLKASPLEQLNAEPLYPTETILWNKSLVPDDKYDLSELSVVLPKLNLQFLSLHDYLMRNYYLFRLESAYEIRQDIEDAVLRMKPWQSEHDLRTLFGGWARMAQALVDFRIVDIADARAGERAPERVRAEFAVTLDVRDDVRNEWEQLRVHDACFLLCIQAHAPRGTRFDTEGNVPEQTGLRFVRGCEIEGMLDESGNLIEEPDRIAALTSGKPIQFTTLTRRYRVLLDPNQYYQDICAVREGGPNAENPYKVLNVVMRRRPEANNFKAVLETLRVLMNSGHTIVPDWLKDVLLGYGDPGSASWQALPQRQNVLAFNDTFLDFQHVRDSFPQRDVQLLANNNSNVVAEPPFRIRFDASDNVVSEIITTSGEKKPDVKSIIQVEPYRQALLSPYPQHLPRRNQVRFTPAQTRAILSGMQPGLTMIVGPPGTGKTDVAVQIIANIYHNFPQQRTVIVTHSNQALNQIFEKLMQLDIDERHLLRLGHGEEALETSKDFSRYGRVDYVLRKRLELLREVERLQASFDISGAAAVSHTCETSNYFFLYQVRPRWRRYLAITSSAREEEQQQSEHAKIIVDAFPFYKFFADTPQPLFAGNDAGVDWQKAELCWRYIQHVFDQLEEFRAFELLRGGPERSRYLLIKEAKIIAMTCTHAAIRRQDLVAFGFTYDNIVMEEAAQILEVETFVPLLLQRPEHGQHNRLKRWVMLGDHNQLPPIIQNKAFEKYSNMEQSLFTRFVRLGVPHVLLDAQGRGRPSLRELFSWRYGNKLGDLPHVLQPDTEFTRPNAGLLYEYQLINVEDFNGVGETMPSRHFVQNLAEAEYVVGLFMYMRLLGYPAERITILAAYQGQRQLIQDVVGKRCADNPLFGEPARVSTVDKYQGQQNDYVLLSMVRTLQVGYLRDVRRIIVALSRARLGLYVFARAHLFLNCYETAPAFDIMARRPTDALYILPEERWPATSDTGRTLEAVEKGVVKIPNMPAMVNYVHELYERRVRQNPEEMLKLFSEHQQKRELHATTKWTRQQPNNSGGTAQGVKRSDAGASDVPFYELPHDVKRRRREEQRRVVQPSSSISQVLTNNDTDATVKPENVVEKTHVPPAVIIHNEIDADAEEEEGVDADVSAANE